jgi:hypothetical protein
MEQGFKICRCFIPEDSELTYRNIIPCLRYSLGDNEANPAFREFMDAITNIQVPYQLVKLMRSRLKISEAKTKKILTHLTTVAIEAFRKNIWIKRCGNMIDWEKRHHITIGEKWAKSHNIQEVRHPSNTQRDFDTRPRSQVTRQLRQIRALPYFHDQMKVYIKHNAVRPWVFKNSKIFNRYTTIWNQDDEEKLGFRSIRE